MIGTLIGLGVTALGSIWGAVSSAKKGQDARRTLDAQHTANQAYYNREYNSDYAQRGDFKAIVSKQRDMLSEAYRRARNTNVVAGGTDSALTALQGAQTASTGETMSQVAQAGATYKDKIASQRLTEAQGYATDRANTYNEQAKQVAQSAGQATQAGAGLIAGDDNSWSEDKENWSWLFKKKA